MSCRYQCDWPPLIGKISWNARSRRTNAIHNGNVSHAGPLHVAADQNEDALQQILDDHLAFCVSEQGQFNNVEAQEPEPIQLTLSDDSIYQIVHHLRLCTIIPWYQLV